VDTQKREPKISCNNLWKIFGDKPDKLLSNWQQYGDMDKATRLKETGCVVGTQDASFEVEKGEIYCLMGLSGSGKSTLLRCINRLHEPTKGKVSIDGLDITTLPEKELRHVRRKYTSMVFQHFALLPHRRLIDNAAFGLEIQGIDKKERYAKATESLELVGLKGWEMSYPHELSGGMQQRVGLARALATDPEILLMDEAFSALDPMIRRQMQDEFVNLIKRVKKTIVFVTHDLNEAIRIAGHIAIMKDGRIIQQGTPAEIVLRPKSGYVEEFVRDLPKIKFITAGDVMKKPDKWLINMGASHDEILKKMDSSNLRFSYQVDENQRILGAIDYFNPPSGNGQAPNDQAVKKTELIGTYPKVDSNCFLEELLKIGAKTKLPIVVNDAQGRVAGIVSRAKLLKSLIQA
jgi:glycine betaine/proline transport system ATP-binding protein